MKTALIVGAGPAGLTAAVELQRRTAIRPVVCEATDAIGGISQTVQHNGNRMDIGGHRFFSKSERVMNWWRELMPIQGQPSKDDILLQLNDKPLEAGGPDPEKTDRVILLRHRVSRIFFLRKFFDYPISMKKETFLNMGFIRMMRAAQKCCPFFTKTENVFSAELFYIQRFSAIIHIRTEKRGGVPRYGKRSLPGTGCVPGRVR